MSAIYPDFVVVGIATSRVWCLLCSKTNAGQQEPSSFSLCSLDTWSKMGIDSTRLSSHFWLTALTGHRATASQQGTKSERWAATHKYDGRSDWSGAQKDSHLEMAQSQKVGQWQDQKKDHWMAASNWDGWQQVSNCGELQNFQRPRATFPPPSPSSHQHPFSKELSGLSHFGLIDRPIAIASFCRAEKKIISVSILCQASKTPSIEARKHKNVEVAYQQSKQAQKLVKVDALDLSL